MRSAARLASQLDVDWHAVYVETPRAAAPARGAARAHPQDPEARPDARRANRDAVRPTTRCRRCSPTRASTTSTDRARRHLAAGRLALVRGAADHIRLAPAARLAGHRPDQRRARPGRAARPPPRRASAAAIALAREGKAPAWHGYAWVDGDLRRDHARGHTAASRSSTSPTSSCCSCWRSC